MGHLRRLFLILVFSTKLIVNNIANCWIWTADLWCWKRPLYQLSHNHYPIDNVCWVTMWCYPQYCVWHIVTTVGSYNCGIKSYIGQVLMIASFPQLIVALCIAHFLPKIVFSNFCEFYLSYFFIILLFIFYNYKKSIFVLKIIYIVILKHI